MIYPIFKEAPTYRFEDLIKVPQRDTTTIEDFLVMLGQSNEWLLPFAREPAGEAVAGAVGAVHTQASSVEQATKEKKQKSPASLLARLYPFMLTARYSSVTDLCLIGNCTEQELD